MPNPIMANFVSKIELWKAVSLHFLFSIRRRNRKSILLKPRKLGDGGSKTLVMWYFGFWMLDVLFPFWGVFWIFWGDVLRCSSLFFGKNTMRSERKRRKKTHLHCFLVEDVQLKNSQLTFWQQILEVTPTVTDLGTGRLSVPCRDVWVCCRVRLKRGGMPQLSCSLGAAPGSGWDLQFAPARKPSLKQTIIFQPSIYRCKLAVSFVEGNGSFWMMINPLLKEDDETQKSTYKNTNILSATISPVEFYSQNKTPLVGWFADLRLRFCCWWPQHPKMCGGVLWWVSCVMIWSTMYTPEN